MTTWNSNKYAGRSHEIEYLYQPNKNKNMFQLDWANIKSAIVYGLLTGVALGILAIFGYVLKVGDLWGLDWKALVNVGAMSAISGFVTGISLIKNLLTNNRGSFLGVTEVIPDKTN